MAREDHAHLLDALAAIDPATLGYQEWCDCGMALHESGYDWRDWDEWSRRDHARYHEGECESKWRGFGNGTDRVGSGTIVHMAEARGWRQPTGGSGVALDWSDMGTVTSGPDVTSADTEPINDEDTGSWDPCRMLSDYIGALFEDEEHVGYVCESWERDGRRMPKQGHWDRTAGELRRELAKTSDLGAVMGDWDEDAGAWIRFNPLDGQGCGNANVTEYRYALVESDVLDVDRQFPAIKELHLPCAAVVSSGGKSVHAIVRVDAPDAAEYRKRVQWLYDYCDRHGFVTDKQNKNASRLSRMPGATRGGKRQLLLATNIGEESWEAWRKWAEESEDDLPDECDSTDWDEPIDLPPMLIDGACRHGQKVIVVGDSKMGKSYTLIDMAEAICCGGEWLGMECAKGPVFYVNLEIDPTEFRKRQHDVWEARPDSLEPGALEDVKRNFVRWDLRGRATLMSELAPRLVRRVLSRGPRGTFAAVVLDPVYKVNGGDDNDARAVAEFTNALDFIAMSCGCAVIYAHHHPKGQAGGKKSMDRMSGSGVYARDADTVIDFTALDVDAQMRERFGGRPLYRVTFTCRSFQAPAPMDVSFAFPRFVIDRDGMLSGYHTEGEEVPWQERKERREEARREQADTDRREKIRLVRDAIEACAADAVYPTRENILERIGEFDGRQVTMGQLKGWTTTDGKRNLGPFSCDKDEASNRWLVSDDNTSND